MTGEFTIYCNYYYRLKQLLAQREEHFKNLLENAPLYSGQTSLIEIDAIITYYREAQAAKARMNKTFDEITETERLILMVMRHFEIPPGTVLTGEIPGLLEYELWANENDALYINKTNDLEADDNPNIIEIQICDGDEEEED